MESAGRFRRLLLLRNSSKRLPFDGGKRKKGVT